MNQNVTSGTNRMSAKECLQNVIIKKGFELKGYKALLDNIDWENLSEVEESNIHEIIWKI